MATRADFIIDQGSTFSTTIEISQSDGTNLELTSGNANYTARARLSKSYSSDSSVDFTCTINENSPSQDTITISLTSTQTAAIKAGLYVYNVEILAVGDTTVTRVLEGQIEISPSVYNYSSSNGIGDESPSLYS